MVQTKSAQTQQMMLNNPQTFLIQITVVNDQTDDDFADPVREENNANRGSNSLYNWSKPDSGRLSMLT